MARVKTRESKPLLRSKTVTMNMTSIVTVILGALLADPSFEALVGGTVIVLLNASNIVLRMFTSTPIKGVVKPYDEEVGMF